MSREKKEKKEKIPFKDRKIVKWATENAPGIIGNSLDFIGDVTGIEVLENLGEKIAGSAELTPEQKAEAAEVLKADIERLKLENEDRANAREMNVKIQDSEKASWLAKNIAYMIDAFVVLIWGAVTVYIIGRFLNIIKETQGVDFSGVLGIYSGITAMAMLILNFHRGSSVGSKENGAAMRKMLEK